MDPQIAPDVLDSLPDGVVVAGPDGTVETVNAVAREVLGDDARVGASLAQALALVDQHGVSWFESNRPYEGLGIRSGIPEQSWLAPDGSEVLTHARILRSGAGAPVTRVAVTVRSGRGRERLDRERSDLVATVAHELRSPLTGVKGFVQALLNRWDVLNDEQKKLMLTTVHSDSERLARLIAELLDVARLDTGRLSFYPRDVDVVELSRRVVDLVQAATARPVVLEVGEGVSTVFADPDKFTQVLTNLVENGVRHGDGEVRVRLTPTPHGAHFQGVDLEVTDEGSGIDEELRRRVVTKFWTSGTAGGSGLGMYIAHGLTRVHGGEFIIGDRPGGGARITLRWPVEDRRGGSRWDTHA